MALSKFQLPEIVSKFVKENDKLISSYVNNNFNKRTLIARVSTFNPQKWKHFMRQKACVNVVSMPYLNKCLDSDDYHQIISNYRLSMLQSVKIDATNIKSHGLTEFYFGNYKFSNASRRYCKNIINFSSSHVLLSSCLIMGCILRAAVYDKYADTLHYIKKEENGFYSKEHDLMLDERVKLMNLCNHEFSNNVVLANSCTKLLNTYICFDADFEKVIYESCFNSIINYDNFLTEIDKESDNFVNMNIVGADILKE